MALAASVVLGGILFWSVADADGGRLHWQSAALIQLPGALGMALAAAGLLRRQQLRVRAQRAALDVEISGLERDTVALFDHLSRDFDPQFDGVQREAKQIHGLLLDAIDKLVDSFMAMELASRKQCDHALGVIDRQRQAWSAGCAAADQVELVRSLQGEAAAAVEELAAMTASIGMHVNAAVTSLQFQDMAAQLLEQIGRRIDAMQAITRQIVIAPAAPGADGSGYAERVARLRLAVRETSELLALGTRNPVKQVDMRAGEIELF